MNGAARGHGVQRPQRSRQKPLLGHDPPGQCALLMQGSPFEAPPLQVNTHMAPVPSPGRSELVHGVGDEHARRLQVASDGHGHGPLKGYASSFTAPTTATMSRALISALSSGRLACSWAMALIGEPGTFLNLLTSWVTSIASG